MLGDTERPAGIWYSAAARVQRGEGEIGGVKMSPCAEGEAVADRPHLSLSAMAAPPVLPGSRERLGLARGEEERRRRGGEEERRGSR